MASRLEEDLAEAARWLAEAQVAQVTAMNNVIAATRQHERALAALREGRGNG